MISDDHHQSIHKTVTQNYQALLQHLHGEVSHHLPMVSKLTITRPKLGHAVLLHTTNTQDTRTSLRCRTTLCLHETDSSLVVFIPPSFRNIL